jgi:hypothetical protein
MRLVAVAVFVCLLAPSLARVACGWECVDVYAATQPASCHDQESSDRDTLTWDRVTACHDAQTPSLGRVATLLGTLVAAAPDTVVATERSTLSSPPIASVTHSSFRSARLSTRQLRI